MTAESFVYQFTMLGQGIHEFFLGALVGAFIWMIQSLIMKYTEDNNAVAASNITSFIGGAFVIYIGACLTNIPSEYAVRSVFWFSLSGFATWLVLSLYMPDEDEEKDVKETGK